MRADVDHYRTIAWTFAKAARERPKPTSYSYRRSTSREYLEWTLARWERIAYVSRAHALARLRSRVHAALPHPPHLHATLGRRIAFSKRLTLRLRKIYPGRATRQFASARAGTADGTLRLWQRRSAAAALQVASHGPARRLLDAADPLVSAFLCIHRFEGDWASDTGNGYYGGLQMDLHFMRTYGSDYLARWGTADGWPAWAQLDVAERAYRAGRGFTPWPNTARSCGLL